jgi:hypothetical protein
MKICTISSECEVSVTRGSDKLYTIHIQAPGKPLNDERLPGCDAKVCATRLYTLRTWGYKVPEPVMKELLNNYELELMSQSL